MPGRYFDEWQVGDRVEHSISRTVTETDNLLISTLTHNPQPLHIDHEAAAKTEFGKPLVNSVFTFGLMIGVSVNDTTLGTLVIALDAIKAPKTVNNFVFLALNHYYDGVIFHRIINGFMCQGGDPTGTGTGGPGYKFADELPKPGQYEIGSVAMANAGH